MSEYRALPGLRLHGFIIRTPSGLLLCGKEKRASMCDAQALCVVPVSYHLLVRVNLAPGGGSWRMHEQPFLPSALVQTYATLLCYVVCVRAPPECSRAPGRGPSMAVLWASPSSTDCTPASARLRTYPDCANAENGGTLCSFGSLVLPPLDQNLQDLTAG